MPHRSPFVLFTLSVLLSACGPGQLFGPTVTPTPTSTRIPTATVTLTPTAVPTRTPRPTPILYDGDWAGATSAGGRVSFHVEDNQIPSIRVNFGLSANNSTCNVDVNVTISPGVSLSVNTFNIPFQGGVIKGVFDTATTASGTVEASHDSKHCSGGVNLTWTAKKK